MLSTTTVSTASRLLREAQVQTVLKSTTVTSNSQLLASQEKQTKYSSYLTTSFLNESHQLHRFPQALASHLHSGDKRQSALVAVVRLEHHDGHWEVQINGRHSPLPQEAPEWGRKQAEMRRYFLK